MYRDLENSHTPDASLTDRPNFHPERQPASRPDRREIEQDNQRTVYKLQDKSYRLNELESRILHDVGRFRVVEKIDLLRRVYGGDEKTFNRDLTHLHRQSLVRIIAPAGSLTKYVFLTKPAKELTERYIRADPRQEIYYGAAKIRELGHEAMIYRLYHKKLQEIESQGGKPVRVTLDYELKREINKRRAKIKNLPYQKRQERLRQIAEEQKLKVIDGRISLPDLRIEYEGADGELSHFDLEYVTQDYRAGAIAQKRAAGFQLVGDDPHGNKPYGPDLIGGLISL